MSFRVFTPVLPAVLIWSFPAIPDVTKDEQNYHMKLAIISA